MLKGLLSKQAWVIVLLFFLAFVTPSWPVMADKDVQKTCNTFKSPGPYCGLYCLYTIMELYERETDFRKWLKPEYLGSKKGSSLAELKKASLDNGLYAQAVTNMTVQELKSSDYPIILHVKRDRQENTYNHYVLFLGEKDGKAMIFDAPKPTAYLPFYKLAPIWDGTGLIVSHEPIPLAEVFAPARKQYAMFTGAIIGIIAAIRTSRKYFIGLVESFVRSWRLGMSIVQGGGVIVFALLAGMVFHFFSETGFLAHPGEVETVIKANLVSFIPKVSANDVKANRDTATIIDARQVIDYNAGHIERAINIPTVLNAAERNAKLSTVPKDKQLIVYCQSAGCPYAKITASNLVEDGFSNIAIYKDGWLDWNKRQESGDDEN